MCASVRVRNKILRAFQFHYVGGDILNMIDFTYLAKSIYVFLGVLGRFTMEDRKHTHNMRIYPKIHTSINGCVSSGDRSLEDRP